jgi:hypothetical protein
MYLHYLLIFTIFAIGVYAATEPCVEDGIWEERTGEVDYVTTAARIYRNDTSDHSLDQKWLKDACRVQAVMHSCYYWGRNDSKSIDYRRWKPRNPNSRCLPFSPQEFLKRMKNKNLVFMGDSVIAQYFFALVCTLTRLTTLTFELRHHNTGKTKFCPFGNEHCTYIDSTVRIPSINATLKVSRMRKMVQTVHVVDGEYYGHDALWKPLYGLNLSRTAYFYNFGLHINESSVYSRLLQWLVKDLSHFNRTAFPRLYFVETSPQHFGGSNGYYHKHLADELLREHRGCVKNNRSDEDMANLDWRNRLLAEHLNETVQRDYNVRIIKIAKGMYSQHDAHVGPTRNWNVASVDCTHFCFPSGVFDYVIRQIFNRLVYDGFL